MNSRRTVNRFTSNKFRGVHIQSGSTKQGRAFLLKNDQMKTKNKKIETPVTKRKHLSGILELSAMIDNQRVSMKFIDYTVMQAVKKFKQTYNIK